MTSESQKQLQESKKAYSKPVLRVYGNLLELTGHVGKGVNPDPPPHPGGLSGTS